MLHQHLEAAQMLDCGKKCEICCIYLVKSQFPHPLKQMELSCVWHQFLLLFYTTINLSVLSESVVSSYFLLWSNKHQNSVN